MRGRHKKRQEGGIEKRSLPLIIGHRSISGRKFINSSYISRTDELPKFHYWCWNTLTGFTGVLLTLVAGIMYIFATEYSRRNAFRAFWITHNMYPIFFILCILHGAGRLVQPPFFHYFFLGPLVLFTLDKLVSISRKKIEIAVMKAELLPSGQYALFSLMFWQWIPLLTAPGRIQLWKRVIFDPV